MNVLVEIPASGLGPTPKLTPTSKAETETCDCSSSVFQTVCAHTHTRLCRWTCPHPTLQQELLGNIFIMESAGGAREASKGSSSCSPQRPTFPGQAWSLSEAGLGALGGRHHQVPSLARAPGTFRGEGN